MNCAVCNCGYGTEEKQDQKQSAHCYCDNFEIGKGKLSENGVIITGMKEGEVERRIYDESEKDWEDEDD